ncbi:MAG: Uma2 family endonuclease [Methylobacterium sp.]
MAPDVLVAPEPDRDDVSIRPDPIVVFEVLSKSDRDARRGRKLSDYESIASIMHCVVIRQDRREVTVYRRGSAGRFVVDPPGDGIDLSAIGVTPTVETIYAETVLA